MIENNYSAFYAYPVLILGNVQVFSARIYTQCYYSLVR